MGDGLGVEWTDTGENSLRPQVTLIRLILYTRGGNSETQTGTKPHRQLITPEPQNRVLLQR